MSNLSIVNNDLDVNALNYFNPKYSKQDSYAVLTTATTPQVLSNETVFVFCNNSSSGVINLVLPSLSPAGKNLFIVTRNAFAVSSQTAAGVANSVIIDIENNPNATTPILQNTILPISTAGAWVHLVSNGTYWVAVSKSVLLPAPAV